MSDSAREEELFGAITPTDSDHLWYAKERRYEINLVARGGRVVRQIARTVSWFPRDTTQPNFPWIKPPAPRIKDLSVGPDGMLWVLISRANRNWAKHRPLAPPVMRPGMPMQMMPSIRSEEIWECVIEVLDPVRGTLLASKEVGGDMQRFIAPGKVYQQVEDSTGVITLQIWNVKLQRH